MTFLLREKMYANNNAADMPAYQHCFVRVFVIIPRRRRSDILGEIKTFLARYASVRFIILKSLSVGHLILLKDIGSMKNIRSCLIAYVKHF